MNNICAQTGQVRDFEAERYAYHKKNRSLSDAAKGLREQLILRTMQRHELESDEFYSARDKAIAIINSNR